MSYPLLAVEVECVHPRLRRELDIEQELENFVAIFGSQFSLRCKCFGIVDVNIDLETT